jgi:Domain of unknown function (DUF4258)
LSDTLESVKRLVDAGAVRVSDHGYDEMSDDEIRARDVLNGIGEAVALEDYPDYPKGPSVLVLQFDGTSNPIHVVWGIPKGYPSPAVLVTAYRPDPARWSSDFRERLK